MNAGAWLFWQAAIVAVIRREHLDLFPGIGPDEIDWEAWKPLYEQGCAPRSAVSQAISSTFKQEAYS